MNRVLAVASTFPKSCSRRISMAPAKYKKPDISHIKRKQALFQEDNGVPVYLKGGAMDYVLYYSSIILMLTSLGTACVSTYKLMATK